MPRGLTSNPHEVAVQGFQQLLATIEGTGENKVPFVELISYRYGTKIGKLKPALCIRFCNPTSHVQAHDFGYSKEVFEKLLAIVKKEMQQLVQRKRIPLRAALKRRGVREVMLEYRTYARTRRGDTIAIETEL